MRTAATTAAVTKTVRGDLIVLFRDLTVKCTLRSPLWMVCDESIVHKQQRQRFIYYVPFLLCREG